MKLIEQYVYTVMEHLPLALRDDIGKELRTNIEDMLPENYSEEDVYQVLMKLGSPWKLASEYNTQKRYLIGPGYYEKYISMLKMVIGICVSVFIGISLLVWIIEFTGGGDYIDHITKLISSVISSGVNGALQATFWVTIVFVILERTGMEPGYIPIFNKEWTPDHLPEIPVNDKLKISRGETVFSMFFTILFTALIFFQPQLIAFYSVQGKEPLTSTPLFDLDRLKFYLPIILILTVIQLVLSVWKYIARSWNLPLIIMNAIYNMVICILVIVWMSDPSLFNSVFTDAIANAVKTSPLTISTWLTISKRIFVVVFISICLWDSIINFLRFQGRSRI